MTVPDASAVEAEMADRQRAANLAFYETQRQRLARDTLTPDYARWWFMAGHHAGYNFAQTTLAASSQRGRVEVEEREKLWIAWSSLAIVPHGFLEDEEVEQRDKLYRELFPEVPK